MAAKGRAPGRFIAARIDGAGKPVATRPVCRYPREARYRGGDSGDAAGFVCADPAPAASLTPRP